MAQTQKKKTPQNHYLVTESYLMTRGAALHFPSKQFQNLISMNDTVYGLVVDMPVNPQTLITLVIYINGAANLYFNNGGSYTGASQRYSTVVQLGRGLVAQSNRILGEATRTKKLDLPIGREHHIFLLTKNGTYRKAFLPTELKDESSDLQSVFALYQRLMQELNAAQMKDRAKARTQK